MKALLKFTLFAFFAMAVAQPVNGQRLLKKLQEKVQEKVEQKVEERADQKVDEAKTKKWMKPLTNSSIKLKIRWKMKQTVARIIQEAVRTVTVSSVCETF